MTVARSPFDSVYDDTVALAIKNVWTGFNYDDGWEPLVKTLSGTIAKVITATPLDEVNDAAEEWARERVGSLIVGITTQEREAVRRITGRAIKHGWSDDELAKAIEKKVGLDGRFADAVENYRAGLVKRGYPKGDASRMAKTYADQVRYNRAQTIARTEVQTALVEGQRIIWKEALETGDLPAGTKRQWILHPSEANCRVCKAMNGKRTTINGTYRNGRDLPAHPNCRCHERLVTPEGLIVKVNHDEIAQRLVANRIEKGKKKAGRGPNPKSTPKEIVGHHGHHPHGKSILWPALYEHLRKKGMTKQKAAMISNGLWRKKHGLPPKSARAAK